MTDILSALDATFLELEQGNEGALMSIGGVMVFDPGPDGTPTIEEVRENLASRLGLLPRYSQRLSSPRTGGLAWPRWCDDEQLDIRLHVRRVALPAPGSDDDLREWAADFYSHRLDRTRPLWEAPPVLHATLARSLYATRLFNVTITNVPGPQLPLYAFGAQLREVHPVVPLAADHAVGIAIFSYNGFVTFGVIADSESTPDLDVLAFGIEAGIQELLAVVATDERPPANVEVTA